MAQRKNSGGGILGLIVVGIIALFTIGVYLIPIGIVVWIIWAARKSYLANQKIKADQEQQQKALQAKRDQEQKIRYKEELSKSVDLVIPRELNQIERMLGQAETELATLKKYPRYTLQKPTWEAVAFQERVAPHRRRNYLPFKVADIKEILKPNPLAWSAEEEKIFDRKCKYPGVSPSHTTVPFREVKPIKTDWRKAEFKYDSSVVSAADLAMYFEQEQAAVAEYNSRLAALLTTIEIFNREAAEYNIDAKQQWEKYAEENQRLEEKADAEYRDFSEGYLKQCREEVAEFRKTFRGYEKGEKESVIQRLNWILGTVALPASIPHSWEADYDEEQRIAVVEIGLPDVVHEPLLKEVALKDKKVLKPLNQTERKEVAPSVHPAILLRFAYEIFRNDVAGTISLLVLNGWVRFDDPRTGVETKAYTASLMVEKNQIVNMNLTKIEPVAAFNNLKGKSAGRLIEIVPIEPTLSLNKKDKRFIDAKEVLNKLGNETNLASMEWQDFEYLIRELFEKEFAGRGAEVKITQASRDRGVDAVIFDPDPIHGGKIVVQAKRYTNTVDVSAVRDLCAVVKKEGAIKGILVTTSIYGADAYAFANNEPVTLLNGAELLGLLKKHGYKFRIDLDEARRLGHTIMRKPSNRSTFEHGTVSKD